MLSSDMASDEEYAAIGIDLSGPQVGDDRPDERGASGKGGAATDVDDREDPGESPTQVVRLTVEEKIGRAVLRLRLYWGWSQAELGRRSGVDQTTISRLESGRQRGLSLRRLAAILRALRVGEIDFLPPRPIVEPTALELMLYSNPWERAGGAADRRVNRRRSA